MDHDANTINSSRQQQQTLLDLFYQNGTYLEIGSIDHNVWFGTEF